GAARATRGPGHARRERDPPRIPGDPPHEQPRIGLHVRRHQRGAHAGARAVDHRNWGVQMTELAELAGYDLGRRTVSYTDSDAILYALCVGAKASELELVYERDLKVLPTFGLGLGLWAVEKAGNLGVYDRLGSLHAAQRLTVHEAFAPSGTLDMQAHVANVWDKGKAAMVDIVVECAQFTAVYSIFL